MAVKINKDIYIGDTDRTLANVVNSSNYSTSEVVVGTYNGKPLYRRILSGSMPTSLNSWNTIATISNIDCCKPLKGVLKEDSKSLYNLFFYEYCTWYIYKPNGTINIYPKMSWVVQSNKTYEIVIEYTKTTD